MKDLPGDFPANTQLDERPLAKKKWAQTIPEALEFKKNLEPYTLEYVSKLSKVPQEKLVSVENVEVLANEVDEVSSKGLLQMLISTSIMYLIPIHLALEKASS